MAHEAFRAKAPEIMRNIIRDLGVSAEEAAAIVGNFGVETGGFMLRLEKGKTTKASTGFGWAQWTGSRREELERWCAANGHDPYRQDEAIYDAACYAFFIYEITNTWEKRAIPAMKAEKGIEAKTLSFMKLYERPGVLHQDRRIAMAMVALDAYRSKDMVPVAADDPPWLAKARELVGLKEIVGSSHESKVVAFFAEAGHPGVKDDETAWCAAFANAMLKRAGYTGTGLLNARSFLNWGEPLSKPRHGCIAVFKRGNSAWQGHVAFYVGETPTHVRILGGNQSNAVSITTNPKTGLLGYRWPKQKVVAKPSAVDEVLAKRKEDQSPPVPTVAKEQKPAEDAKAGGFLVAIAGVLAAAWTWFTDWLPWIVGGLVVVAALYLVYYRLRYRRYPWTSLVDSLGVPSQEPLPPSLPRSAPSLGLPSADQLAASLAVLQAAQSLEPSALPPPPKQLVKRLPTTQKRRPSSRSLKRTKVSASARKQRSKLSVSNRKRSSSASRPKPARRSKRT